MADSTQGAAGTPNEQRNRYPSSEPVAQLELTMDVSSYAVGGFPRKDVPPATPDATSSFNKFIESLVNREVLITGVEVTGAEAFHARYDTERDTVILLVAATGVEVANGVNVGDIRLRVQTR